jgi:hypothetical protein
MNDITLNFPSRYASKEEKADKSYGLQYASAIYNVYTKDSSSLFNKKEKFVRNRKYAEGTHSIDKFKDLLGLNGDQSYLNLDFTPVPIIPKFVDLLVGEMMNQEFRITAEAVDDRSLTQFDEMKSKLYAKFILKDVNKEIEKATGWKHQSASAMRNSLMRDGWVIDSGSRRNTDEGNPAIVWIGCGINNLATEAMPNAKLRLD